jgi:cell division septal protein FtsQ
MKLSLPVRGQVAEESSSAGVERANGDRVRPQSGLSLGDPGSRAYFLLFLAAALALILGGALLILEPYLPTEVREIRVSGAQYLSNEEARRIAGLELGRVYDSDELFAAEDRLRLHPAIESAEVRREGAGVLALVLKERGCAAIVQTTREPEILFEVDGLLTILSENRVRCRDAPLVVGDFQRSTDRFNDARLAGAVAGLARLRSAYPELAGRVSELRMNAAGGVTLSLAPTRVRVEMPADFASDARLKRLYAAVSYFEKGGYQAGVIDLRGPDAVLAPAQ